MDKNKRLLFGILITVFIDLLAFGMFIPDIQLRACEYAGGEGFLVGFTISVFSISQFIFAPILGKISDNIGRRPVLLVSTILTTLSFIIYANASTLPLMILARIIVGISSSNIGVAQAYISDISNEENRTRYLGLIGAALAAGFTLGFPMGMLLITLGKGSPYLLGYTACIFSAINFLYIFFWLPESRKRELMGNNGKPELNPFKKLSKHPHLYPVFLIYFIGAFAIILVDTTFMQYAVKYFYMSRNEVCAVLFMLGISAGLMNGVGVQKLTMKYSNEKLAICSMPIISASFYLLPVAWPWVPLLLTVLAMGLSRTLIDTCIVGIISKNIDKDNQGGVFGITQSLTSMARMVGSILANMMLAAYSWGPYVLSGSLIVVNICLAYKYLIKDRKYESAREAE